MNNRYLYKAKKKKNTHNQKTEWVIGFYMYLSEKHVLVPIESEEYYDIEGSKNSTGKQIIEIDIATLCRGTGLKDKNGDFIWENDVVEIGKEDGYFSVDWDEDSARFVMNGVGLTVDFDNYWSHETEVFGNKFDSH